jgi:hypothetical protein
MPDFVSHCGNRPRNIRRRRPRSSNLLRVYANVHRERTVLALTKVTRLICILDEGCDLGHPDLKFEAAGINLGSMSGDGSPTGDHRTACAGIAAAIVDNALGVAGMAGACRILPVAFQNWTDAEVAAGINYAAAHSADVISMSFGQYGLNDGMSPRHCGECSGRGGIGPR